MMSGGDLDGDVYFVTWDKELLRYITPEKTEEPADYSKNTLIKEGPDGDSIADYITFYLNRDVLGIVSNLWVVVADICGQNGPRSKFCKDLAYMASVAVDFAKHGDCVAKKNFKEI